jgi:pimeloyl-ACP methyl ester carboxylesterase
MRVKPKLAGEGSVRRKPLLLLHGWPGSFYEFHKMVPLLTHPVDDLAFELIIPSMPGYGFSDAPQKPGLHLIHVARIFGKLMERLGHDKYFIHGDDIGAGIGRYISLLYPPRVLGLHAVFFYPTFVRQVNNLTDPAIVRETGYIHMHATKPDTLGAGLSDSPAGLAAHMLEKYSTLTKRGNTRRPDGGLTESLDLDELLTNVMIYWVTNTATSAARLYKEAYDFEIENDIDFLKPTSPVLYGFARFPEEAFKPTKEFLSQVFPNLIQYTFMPKGGHFASFENPELLTQDIRSFVKKAFLMLSLAKNNTE